eukprot:3002726-Prymnesium_polylepis.2
MRRRGGRRRRRARLAHGPEQCERVVYVGEVDTLKERRVGEARRAQRHAAARARVVVGDLHRREAMVARRPGAAILVPRVHCQLDVGLDTTRIRAPEECTSGHARRREDRGGIADCVTRELLAAIVVALRAAPRVEAASDKVTADACPLHDCVDAIGRAAPHVGVVVHHVHTQPLQHRSVSHARKHEQLGRVDRTCAEHHLPSRSDAQPARGGCRVGATH